MKTKQTKDDWKELGTRADRTQEDYKRLLCGIANAVGMRNNELYAKFMIKRFPQERSISYLREWAFRFMSGDVTAYMDLESKKIYLGCVK